MRSFYLTIRLTKILSLLGSLSFLLYILYYLPDQIAIHYNSSGIPDNFLSRDAFFYVFASFILLLNVVLSLIGRLIPGLPAQVLSVPSHWLADAFTREELMYTLRNWLNSLATALNVFLIMLLFVTLRLHTNQKVFLSDFTWVLFVGVAIVIGWVVYLFVRLRAKPSVEMSK